MINYEFDLRQSVYFFHLSLPEKSNHICQYFQLILIVFILITQKVNVFKIILVYEECSLLYDILSALYVC